MKRIIHLSSDNVFLDYAIEQFQHYHEAKNDVLVWSEKKELKYVKTCGVKILNPTNFYLNDLLEELKSYNLIVLHSLDVTNSRIVYHLEKSKKQKICWLRHGYEIYSTSKFTIDDIYSKKTIKQFILKNQNLRTKIKETIRPLVECVFLTENKLILEAAKKVDYFFGTYKEEYELIKVRFNLSASFYPFFYLSLEKIISDSLKGEISGEHILLGNSATVANNHIDVIDKLKKKTLMVKQKIIMPISYGDHLYAKKIEHIGRAYFANQFEPIKKFMPIEKYNEILNTCSITIMNHYRQQAVGIVFSMIYQGSKIFLNERNTLFHFLKRIGISVYSVDVDMDKENALKPLSKKDRNNNRKIITSLINEKKLIKDLKGQLDDVFNKFDFV